MKKILIRILAAVLLIACCFLLRQYLEIKDAEAERAEAADSANRETSGGSVSNKRGYDTPVDKEHPALTQFGQDYENREAFLGFSGDLTGDGLEDLIIIFHEDERTDICWMCVAVRQGGGDVMMRSREWRMTEAVRAPVDKQKVRVFDMDREEPLEFIITGEKEGQTGYAIYRIIDGELTDLFAEDMRDCC